MIDNLFDAIYTDYNACARLKAAITSLHPQQAKQGTALPYGVYELITATSILRLGSQNEELVIQFNLFCDDRAEVMAAYEALDAVYHGCSLTVSGYHFVEMKREVVFMPDSGVENVWQCTVRYKVFMTKN